MAFYAWSPILYGAEVEKGTGVKLSDKRVEFGDSVTQKNLGVSDADWDALVESKAVRDYAPPELPKNFDGSVVDHLRNEIAKASEASVEAAAMSLGGSYFGPTPEEALMGEGEASEEEAAKEE